MSAAPQPLTATHARRAAVLATLSAILVLAAGAAVALWALSQAVAWHAESGDDVITLAFAAIAALALARLGLICLLSGHDLWRQAGAAGDAGTSRGRAATSGAAAASEVVRRSTAPTSKGRVRAASIFLALAAFSGVGASAAGAAAMPTSTSSTQSLSDAGLPGHPASAPEQSSTGPTTASMIEAPSPDFAVPGGPASDAPSAAASSTANAPSSSDAPSPDAAAPTPAQASTTETSPTPSTPTPSSPASATSAASSPTTPVDSPPSFASATPVSKVAATTCADLPNAEEPSTAPDPGWTPSTPAPDRVLCRLVTSGSGSAGSTQSTPATTHVVLRGDTLWSIAASRLPADAPAEVIAEAVNAWIEANPSLRQHPDLLTAGDVLQAPTTASQAAAHEGSAVQR